MGEDLLLADGQYEGGWLLSELDEYNLYCHYMGYAPNLGTTLFSPIRQEQHPSFQLFESTKHLDREYMWKDHGTGQSGDIFALVQYMFNLPSRGKAVEYVAIEFGKGHGEVPRKNGDLASVLAPRPKPLKSISIEIRVLAREWLRSDLDYWNKQGIDLATLTRYRVSPLKYYWMVFGQVYPTTADPMTYCYRENSDGKILYKLYRPKSSTHRFRNNYTAGVVEGYHQLDREGKLLVITKSTKECMWLRRNMSINAVAGRSETTHLSDLQIEHLYSRFPTIISFMDNDPAGNSSADFYEVFSIPAVFLPLDGPKDITDYTALHGLAAAIQVATLLLKPWL